MAKRESIDVLSQTISDDTEVLIMENSDSESDSDVASNANLDTGGEDGNNSVSLENVDNENFQVNTGPVLSLQCLHDDDDEEEEEEEENETDEVLNEKPKEIEEHPNFLPVKIVAVKGSSQSSSSSHPQSSIPARNNWEGAHNFRIKIQYTDIPRRSENAIFSETQQKLYVAKDHPFKVLVFAENVPKDSVIKITAVFALVEHAYEVVQRCPTHEQQDFSKGNPVYQHFVQCVSKGAVYMKNPVSGKLSLSVPYEKPQGGELYTTYLFKLTCFSSCSGGINRRPFMLIFSLEKDNIPLGRQTIEAKVCACPLRDFKLDEDREDRQRKKLKTDSSIKSSSDAETVKTKYTISVKDPELYLFLRQMKCLYEMSAYSSKIQSGT